MLTKVQNTALAAAVAQLRYQLNTVGILFTVAANHLNSEISQTPDYQLSRKISSVTTGGGGHGSGRLGDRGGVDVVAAEVAEVEKQILGTIPRRNGKSCHLKSETKFAGNATGWAGKAAAREVYPR